MADCATTAVKNRKSKIDVALSEYTFRACIPCAGYGVKDNGQNCTNCGGSGTGGLHSVDGCIGSGEVIVETATGRFISLAEFTERMKAKRANTSG